MKISQRIVLMMALCVGAVIPSMAQESAIGPSGSADLISVFVDTFQTTVDSLALTADSLAINADSTMALPDSAIASLPVNDSVIDLKVMHIYKRDVVKQNCLFVVSKKECILSVYEVVKKDTVLVATFPVCYGKNPGNKTKTGDGCTPECSYQHPFYISQIQDSHTWRHDFKDGRGSILAYGHWFMRLDLSKSDCHPNVRSNRSIGIHGSTNNASSVPGRGSEGCIRLRDKDLLLLHDLYAIVGTKVIVLPAK